MKNEDLLAKIKAEIERLMDEYKPIAGGVDEITGAHIVLAELLDVLDTLESEKPVPKDREEAAEEYLQKVKAVFLRTLEHPTAKDAFIAGAKWDRSQMMEKAVDADVMLTLHDKTGDISLHTGYLPKELGIKYGDKVKIIIVKED